MQVEHQQEMERLTQAFQGALQAQECSVSERKVEDSELDSKWGMNTEV
jgi:hypothetical protein